MSRQPTDTSSLGVTRPRADREPAFRPYVCMSCGARVEFDRGPYGECGCGAGEDTWCRFVQAGRLTDGLRWSDTTSHSGDETVRSVAVRSGDECLADAVWIDRVGAGSSLTCALRIGGELSSREADDLAGWLLPQLAELHRRACARVDVLRAQREVAAGVNGARATQPVRMVRLPDSPTATADVLDAEGYHGTAAGMRAVVEDRPPGD